jgi:hypothetical protein
MNPLHDVQVNLDSVTVVQQVINRPDYVSRSDWVNFWEDVKYSWNEPHCVSCGDHLSRY